MTDLVTDAAIDAAEIARRLTPDYTDALIPVLAAVAPFIAAEALRQAKQQVGRMNFGLSGARVHLWLDDLADELVADAAFTGMVQQGQEIGDE